MRFQILDILPYVPNPLTGRLPSPSDRLSQSVQMAVHAERLGFDAYAYGERHTGHVLSPSNAVMLGAVAATTSRIRLQTGVCVLPILDPVRVAEDFATVDQLSRGRLELVIGKGNEAAQFPLFGLQKEDQDELMVEKYELLRRLWRSEPVTWSGDSRPPLTDASTLPRPFAGAPRIWHGSATKLNSAELAARWGDPLFSANVIQPRENYKRLIDHYRERYAAHGHDPRFAYVAAGSSSLFIADTHEQAVREFGPIYENMVRVFGQRPGNESPYRDIEHAIAEGPVLVGTPQEVIDKIMYFHDAFEHDLQSVSAPFILPFEQQMEMLDRLSAEVMPVVRRAAPTTLWTDADPYGRRPAHTGREIRDAASIVSESQAVGQA